MLIQRDLTVLMHICEILATGIHTARLCDRRGLSVRVIAWGYYQCTSLHRSIEQDHYWYYATDG